MDSVVSDYNGTPPKREIAMNVLLMIAAFIVTASPAAQWRVRTPGIPRTPDGKANLSAPAPKTADGKTDITGLWRPAGGYVGNIARDLDPAQIPYQPWAAALFKERAANNSKDDPTASCIVGGVPRSDLVSYPLKVLQVPGMIVILYEAIHSYRQIFTDGRPLPEDPNPTWFGYSTGRWEGNAFVVETAGFKDEGWLDNAGRPATDALRVTERFVRKDFGHMDIQITIDDPKAYTKPWSMTLPLTLQPDDELIEYICNENNRYFEIIPKTSPGDR
jgi:hypothetical protein